MYIYKKFIIYGIIIIIVFSSFSGCILEDLAFGTSFSLNSWSIEDENGFPCISMNFSSSGTIKIKLFGPDNDLIDTDIIFYGSNNSILYLASFRSSVPPGNYILKVYNKDDEEIFEKIFIFNSLELSFLSCEQQWWNNESLISLMLTVYNKGDTPAYPHIAEIFIDSKAYSDPTLSNVILPKNCNNIDCFIYKEDFPIDTEFTIKLKDSLGIIIGTGSFKVNISKNVTVKDFKWRYKFKNQHLSIPHPEFLYNYYNNLERSSSEDYSLYISDIYDNRYINIIINQLLYKVNTKDDFEIINYVASFVQNLNYKKDSNTNDTFEYPRYPVETIDNNGGDCEDLAILTASILDGIGYDVALFRFVNHMAIGVNLNEDIPNYKHYIDTYYFLETTTKNQKLGYIPSEYKNRENLTIYTISNRSLLIHKWQNGTITILKNTYLGDLVKVTFFIENLGIATAENFFVTAGFYDDENLEINVKKENVTSLKHGEKKKVTLFVDIPQNVETWFKTKIYLENKIVDEKESISSFP